MKTVLILMIAIHLGSFTARAVNEDVAGEKEADEAARECHVELQIGASYFPPQPAFSAREFRKELVQRVRELELQLGGDDGGSHLIEQLVREFGLSHPALQNVIDKSLQALNEMGANTRAFSQEVEVMVKGLESANDTSSANSTLPATASGFSVANVVGGMILSAQQMVSSFHIADRIPKFISRRLRPAPQAISATTVNVLGNLAQDMTDKIEDGNRIYQAQVEQELVWIKMAPQFERVANRIHDAITVAEKAAKEDFKEGSWGHSVMTRFVHHLTMGEKAAGTARVIVLQSAKRAVAARDLLVRAITLLENDGRVYLFSMQVDAAVGNTVVAATDILNMVERLSEMAGGLSAMVSEQLLEGTQLAIGLETRGLLDNPDFVEAETNMNSVRALLRQTPEDKRLVEQEINQLRMIGNRLAEEVRSDRSTVGLPNDTNTVATEDQETSGEDPSSSLP